MNKLKNYLALLLITSLTTSAAEQWWKVNGVPEIGNFRGGQVPDDAPDDMKAFLKKDTFAEWETYEDELVKIQYPKHPLLKLEVKKNNANIKVEGGVCSTVDNSFQNAYYLTAGDATYGVFLVQAADWLDDGICLCGPMVHHVYNIEEGCLVRFSLLPGGAVKKAQMVGDKLRLMSFEWTHLACPKNIYEEMVERMQLKVKSKFSSEELKDKLSKQYGFSGKAGLIQSSMKVDEAIKIMGKPAEQNDSEIEWHGISGDYRTMVTVIVKDGSITEIKDSSTRRITGKAMKGTLSWATEQISDENGNIEEGHKIEESTKKQVFEIALEVLESDKDRAWRAMSIIESLAESYAFTDPRIVEMLTTKKLALDYSSFSLLDIYMSAGKITTEQKSAWIYDALKDMKDLDVYSLEGSGFALPFETAQEFFTELIDEALQLNQVKAKLMVDDFLKQKNPSWVVPLLENSKDILTEQQKSDLVLDALVTGQNLKNGHLVNVGIKKAIEIKPNAETKVKILKALKNLPKGEDESNWNKTLNTAIEHLSI